MEVQSIEEPEVEGEGQPSAGTEKGSGKGNWWSTAASSYAGNWWAAGAPAASNWTTDESWSGGATSAAAAAPSTSWDNAIGGDRLWWQNKPPQPQQRQQRPSQHWDDASWGDERRWM